MNVLLTLLGFAAVTVAQLWLLHWLDRRKSGPTDDRVVIRPARSGLVRHPND